MKTFKITKRLMAIVAIILVGISALAQNVRKHIVDRGETLASIAEKYAVSTEEIVKLNPDAAQFVYVGMELTIPKVEKKVEIVEETTENNHTNNKVFDDKEQVGSVESKITTNLNRSKGINREGYDFFLEYAPDAKMYGFGFNRDFNKFLYMHFNYCSNLKFGKNDMTTMLGVMGFGLQQRFCFNDNLMLSIKACPYGALSGYDVTNEKGTKEFKDEFTYGAMAEVSLGVKLFTNKNGNDVYLTAGYSLSAAEFKTKGMFDSGMIMLGYSIIY